MGCWWSERHRLWSELVASDPGFSAVAGLSLRQAWWWDTVNAVNCVLVVADLGVPFGGMR